VSQMPAFGGRRYPQRTNRFAIRAQTTALLKTPRSPLLEREASGVVRYTCRPAPSTAAATFVPFRELLHPGSSKVAAGPGRSDQGGPVFFNTAVWDRVSAMNEATS
jgi:hypothetical protein